MTLSISILSSKLRGQEEGRAYEPQWPKAETSQTTWVSPAKVVRSLVPLARQTESDVNKAGSWGQAQLVQSTPRSGGLPGVREVKGWGREAGRGKTESPTTGHILG